MENKNTPDIEPGHINTAGVKVIQPLDPTLQASSPAVAPVAPQASGPAQPVIVSTHQETSAPDAPLGIDDPQDDRIGRWPAKKVIIISGGIFAALVMAIIVASVILDRSGPASAPETATDSRATTTPEPQSFTADSMVVEATSFEYTLNQLDGHELPSRGDDFGRISGTESVSHAHVTVDVRKSSGAFQACGGAWKQIATLIVNGHNGPLCRATMGNTFIYTAGTTDSRGSYLISITDSSGKATTKAMTTLVESIKIGPAPERPPDPSQFPQQ